MWPLMRLAPWRPGSWVAAPLIIYPGCRVPSAAGAAPEWQGLLERGLDAALGGRARGGDPPLGVLDRDVVDARLPAAHQAVLVELPQLVAVAAPPPAIRVVGLILEPDRD